MDDLEEPKVRAAGASVALGSLSDPRPLFLGGTGPHGFTEQWIQSTLFAGWEWPWQGC